VEWWHIPSVGQLYEPKKLCQDCPMSTTHALWSVRNRTHYLDGICHVNPMSRYGTAREFTTPSLMSVLQMTNTGVSKPRYEAIISIPVLQ